MCSTSSSCSLWGSLDKALATVGAWLASVPYASPCAAAQLSAQRGLEEVLSWPACFFLGNCQRSASIDSHYQVHGECGQWCGRCNLVSPVPLLEVTTGEHCPSPQLYLFPMGCYLVLARQKGYDFLDPECTFFICLLVFFVWLVFLFVCFKKVPAGSLLFTSSACLAQQTVFCSGILVFYMSYIAMQIECRTGPIDILKWNSEGMRAQNVPVPGYE